MIDTVRARLPGPDTGVTHPGPGVWGRAFSVAVSLALFGLLVLPVSARRWFRDPSGPAADPPARPGPGDEAVRSVHR